MKRRVVLVDDEARVVQGLQRALRTHRDAWDVHTATSGAAALALFEAGPVDVIISDMRMPEMDGATLLAEVKRLYPETVRIVLSGQTAAEAATRALPVAHQFLSKPTDPVAIGELLTRTAAMKDALPDAAVRVELGRLDALPSPRAIREELAQAIADGADDHALTAIVERDAALALKLLQTVNSGFFGLRARICDIGEAIAYLGVDLVEVVVASGGTVDAPPRTRAIAIASLARQIAGGHERGAVAYAAALFSSLGRLAITVTDPYIAADLELPIAAYLLDLWGIPRVIVDALIDVSQVEATLAERTKLMPADAVWIAQRLFEGTGVPDDYLVRLGVELPKAA
ncbi:MAG: response regulator [Labilithrix sp.]